MFGFRHSPLLVIPLLAATLPTLADVVQLEPSRDNSIYSESTNSAGGSSWLFSGITASNDSRRALVAFDLVGSVPAGATINSVTLSFVATRTGPGSGPGDTAAVHRLTTDWGEGDAAPGILNGAGATAGPGDATWQEAMNGAVSWTTPGGDFLTASATQPAPTVPGQALVFASSAALIADVQAWVDDPSTNFGWIIVTQSEIRGARAYGAREGAMGERPVLTVDFDAAASPVAATTPHTTLLLALGALLSLAALVFRRG